MSFNQIAPATIQFRGITPWDRYPWFQALRPCTQRWIHMCYFTGSLTYQEIQWAETYLAQPIYAAGLEAKMVATYPFLGAGPESARCPLHDLYGIGPALNFGVTPFTSSNLGTSALGLVSSSSSTVRWLETNIAPGTIANVNAGAGCFPAGIGWYERNGTFGTVNTEPMGCNTENQASTTSFSIDLRSNLQKALWGPVANGPSVASTATNSDYYVENSTLTTLTLYKDGASIATTAASGGSTAGRLTMILGGIKFVSAGIVTCLGYNGRGGIAYMTTGTLGSTGAASLHPIMAAFCTATGR